MGNLAKAATVSLISITSGRFDQSLIFLGILGIPSAAIAGAVVAAILLLLARWHSFGILGRAIIRAALLFIPGILAYIAGVSSWSADDISTWAVASLLYIDFGMVTGAVAGTIAGRKITSET